MYLCPTSSFLYISDFGERLTKTSNVRPEWRLDAVYAPLKQGSLLSLWRCGYAQAGRDCELLAFGTDRLGRHLVFSHGATVADRP